MSLAGHDYSVTWLFTLDGETTDINRKKEKEN